MQDVSEDIKTVRGPLASPEALLAAIIDSSDDAIVSKDLNGIVTSWNKGAEATFGYTADEVVGQPIQILFPPDRLHEEEHILGRIRRGERVEHFQTKRRRKNGEILDVSVTISPIKNAGGEIVGASKIARDITQQKRAEQMVQEAREHLQRANDRLKEADRLKSEFLATMSHELRTPLNSIIGFTGILRQQIPGPLNAEQVKQLDMVSRSARHLLNLINDILDLSRIEAGRMDLHLESVDVARVVDEVVRIHEPAVAAKQLELVADIPPLPPIRTDHKRLLQVLLNLTSNAVKFTHQGQIKIQAARRDGAVTFAVCDTGIGISPEQARSLFEAFRQVEGSARRRYEGTGLGLYLSKKIVQLLGGQIGVESHLGKGSRFTVTLPLEGPPQPAPQ